MAESDRPTEQVKFRLYPADAMRFRAAARSRGLPLAEFAISMLDRATLPLDEMDARSASPEMLEALTRLAHAIYTARLELRDCRAGLGRGLGLVKNLFNEAPEAAEKHHAVLAEAARDLRSNISKIEGAMDAWNAETIALRGALEAVTKRLARHL